MIFSVLTLSLLSRILRKKIVVKSSLPISSSKFLGRIKSARKITKQFVFFHLLTTIRIIQVHQVYILGSKDF